METICENCGFTLTTSDENHKDNDREDALSSSGVSSSTSTHPSSINVPEYYHEFKDFMETANKAMTKAYPVHQRSRNPRVGVLLLRFEEDDLGVEAEIAPLQEVFEKNYRYETEAWQIPSKSSRSILSSKLNEFRDKYCSESREPHDALPLLIVYYGGHAAQPPEGDNSCLWSGKAAGPCAQLNWTDLQPIIFGAPADVLLILDCCFASSATWRAGTSRIGSKETIAACGPSSFAATTGAGSFTTTLTHELRLQADRAKVLTGVALAGYLLDNNFHLRFQPAYARSHRTERNSVALIPLPPLNAVNVDEDATSAPQVRPPRSMVRVLLAIHVKGDPKDEEVSLLRNLNNLAGFLRNENALPISVVGMNIEGVEKVVHPEAAFQSTSTLVLVSVPFATWQLLPDHGACQFVSLISGQNLLSRRTEHESRDAATVSVKEEALIAQSILQDSGYGRLIGDFAVERLKAFNPEDEGPGTAVPNPHDPNYMFFDVKTDLNVDETDALPPYPQEPMFHHTTSQISTITHSTAHESRASEEVIAAIFPDDDDGPAPPYSIDDLLAVD